MRNKGSVPSANQYCSSSDHSPLTVINECFHLSDYSIIKYHKHIYRAKMTCLYAFMKSLKAKFLPHTFLKHFLIHIRNRHFLKSDLAHKWSLSVQTRLIVFDLSLPTPHNLPWLSVRSYLHKYGSFQRVHKLFVHTAAAEVDVCYGISCTWVLVIFINSWNDYAWIQISTVYQKQTFIFTWKSVSHVRECVFSWQKNKKNPKTNTNQSIAPSWLTRTCSGFVENKCSVSDTHFQEARYPGHGGSKGDPGNTGARQEYTLDVTPVHPTHLFTPAEATWGGHVDNMYKC